MARARRRDDALPGNSAPPPAPLGTCAGAISDHPRGATLRLIVTPRASRTALAGVEGDALRLRVAAPPVDGAANAALVRFLAEMAGVPRSSVSLLSGETGRRKVVLVAGTSPDRLAAALDRMDAARS